MTKWLVLISAFMANFFYVALLYSVNSVFIDIKDTFDATRAVTSVIQSIAMGVGLSSGFVARFLIPRIGLSKCGILFTTVASTGLITCFLATSVWHMAISFGVVFGTCAVNTFICSTVATSQQFDGKRRFLALSIQTTGIAFGGMAYPYILTYLSSHYGIRGALLIIGGLTMNCIPGCYLWTASTKSPQKEDAIQQVNQRRIMQYQKDLRCKVTSTKDEVIITKHATGPNVKNIDYICTFPVLNRQENTRCVSIREEQSKDLDNENQTVETRSCFKDLKTMFGYPYFVIFFIGVVITTVSVNVNLFFIADIFLDKDLSKDDTTFGLILLNILNLFGRMLPGLLMQSERVPVLFGSFIATLVLICTMVGLILATSRLIALLWCALLGVPFGMLQSMASVVSASIVGFNLLTTAMSLIITTCGILNAVAGPICGYVRDEFGSYDIPFYVAIATTGIIAVVFLVAMVQHKRTGSRTRRRSTVFYLTSM